MSQLNAREEALKRVQQLEFMIIELRLFLNTHPSSSQALCYLNRYIDLEKSARREYEEAYGPLTLKAVENRCQYDWIDHPWPWEVEA